MAAKRGKKAKIYTCLQKFFCCNQGYIPYRDQEQLFEVEKYYLIKTIQEIKQQIPKISLPAINNLYEIMERSIGDKQEIEIEEREVNNSVENQHSIRSNRLAFWNRDSRDNLLQHPRDKDQVLRCGIL